MFSHKETNKCSPIGRECIEKNFAETFGCNVTCKGIYADVQWTDESMEEDVSREVLKKNKAKRMMNMGKMKMLRLISNYKAFKKNVVRQFSFSSTTSTSSFGKVLCIIVYNKKYFDFR